MVNWFTNNWVALLARHGYDWAFLSTTVLRATENATLKTGPTVDHLKMGTFSKCVHVMEKLKHFHVCLEYIHNRWRTRCNYLSCLE